ncbi:MAG: four-carbon acid sugar kinase family protein [Bacteroidota bacterium]
MILEGMKEQIKEVKSLFASLPELPKADLLPQIRIEKSEKLDAIIVLDDDPTGTQTVYEVPVLTSWTTEIIKKEFARGTPLFYILTNSRSLEVKAAEQLTLEIGQNIRRAAAKNSTRFWVISRSDSTLRGHYPQEVNTLVDRLNLTDFVTFLVPAFFEGGRYTVNNVHYVQQGEQLIPAAQTAYGADKVFGYQHSDLKKWVAEKTEGKVTEEQVVSLTINDLRTKEIVQLVAQINSFNHGSTCIVNAANYGDLHRFSLALLQSKVQPVLRTAASVVRALNGMEERPLLIGRQLKNKLTNGGLIVVGSYVPTSSSQLKFLLENEASVYPLEVEVQQIIDSPKTAKPWIEWATQIDELIAKGQTVVVYTSRSVIKGLTAKENQMMGQRISHAITQIVANLTVQPRYLLSKGGITSSDIATKGLGIQRAMVVGQIIKGVPVWQLGEETKFPNSYQIIFPGNVGTERSLLEVVQKMRV